MGAKDKEHSVRKRFLGRVNFTCCDLLTPTNQF